jgi:signal transduction histidine kinase
MTGAPMPAAVTRGKRIKVILFGAAIMAPCLLLIFLSLRMLAQDRELAEKRRHDSRRLTADRAAQRLFGLLERVTRQVTDKTPAFPSEPGNGLVVFQTHVVDGRIELPWESDPAIQRFRGAVREPGFAAALAAGEQLEFVQKAPAAAIATYRRVLANATSDEQRAAAGLAILRASKSAGADREADQVAHALMQTPVSVVDEEGVPIPVYGARALLPAHPQTAEASRELTGALGRCLDRNPPLNPVAIHMIADVIDRMDLTDRIDEGARADLKRRATARLRDIAQIESLRDAWPSLRPPAADNGETVWTSFGGADLWLVAETTRAHDQHGGVVAVRASPAFDEARRSVPDLTSAVLLARETPDSEALGAGFHRVFVTASDVPDETAALQRIFLIGVVTLTLGIALCGGYFFWRDTQRDLRLVAMRSQFVSSVSHELKTPLTAIRMFAETLRLGRTEHRDEYLDTILNESERLSRLLNNVLDFSKIEQGKRHYRLQAHAIAPIVISAVRTMRYPLEQQGFAVRLDVDDDSLAASCDPDALEQAILNLLSNAMKYSDLDRSITLRVTRIDNNASIEVTDRGIGIPPAEQTRIFEKFYRGTEPDHQRVAGTGLGLTLVEHTVHAHRGTITVDSAPGKGSTFTIRLPLVDDEPRSLEHDSAARVSA